jgi:ferritin
MEEALNRQVQIESTSAYVYLSMSAYCESLNYPGVAHWLRRQAQEEVVHAMRFYDFIHTRGGRVILQALEQPTSAFGSVVDVFEKAVEAERGVTMAIHALYELAMQEKDLASLPFLQTFIVEQIEEEKIAGDTLAMVKMTGTDSQGIFLVDRELMQRV